MRLLSFNLLRLFLFLFILKVSAFADTIYVETSSVNTEAEALAPKIIKYSKAEIEKSQAETLSDLIQYKSSGDFVAQNGPGGTTSLFMRGTNSNHVLVLLDGIVLNDPTDPSDRFDLSTFSLAGIEKLEIYRGSLSSLYGASAIGGVVYMYSEQKVDSALRFSVGNYSYNSLQASHGITSGSHSFGVLAGGHSTKSLSTKGGDSSAHEKDPFLKKSLFLSYRQKREEHEHLLFFRRSIKDQETDSSDPNDELDFVATNRNLLAYQRINSDKKFLLSYDEVFRESFYSSSLSEYKSKSVELKYQWNSINTWQEELVHQVGVKSIGAEISGINEQKNRQNFSLASQYLKETNLAKKAIGARLDKLSDRDVSGSLSLLYKNKKHPIHTGISLSTGFKNPSLYNLYAPTFANPDLKTEKSVQVEFWMEKQISNTKKWSWQLYQIDLTDLIVLPNTYTDPYENTDQAQIKASEFSWEQTLENFSFHTQWMLMDARDKTTDRRLVGRPNNQWSLSVLKEIFNWKVELSYLRQGSRKAYSGSDLAAFDRLDTYFYRELGRHKINLKIQNTLNRRIETVSGFTSPGRWIKLTYQYRL